MEAEKLASKFTGLLNVEVKAPPVIAGKNAIISLLIRNPFPEPVCIESIQAPTSSLLMRRGRENHDQHQGIREASEENIISEGVNAPTTAEKLLSLLDQFKVKEVRLGPLTAHFPEQANRTVNIETKPNCKVDVRGALPSDTVNIQAAEGTSLNVNLSDSQNVADSTAHSEARIVPSHQEDIASFELQTASWLMVKPATLELYALIRYKIGSEARSQVIPVTLAIQPPVTAIVLGSSFGGILGFIARQINSGALANSFLSPEFFIGIMGVIVMSTIAAIVLSRRETSKGFITLEDFYGAFVVGALIGYLGTEYFGKILNGAAKPGT